MAVAAAVSTAAGLSAVGMGDAALSSEALMTAPGTKWYRRRALSPGWGRGRVCDSGLGSTGVAARIIAVASRLTDSVMRVYSPWYVQYWCMMN